VVEIKLKRVDGIAYREAAPANPGDAVPALCLHGFPETSYMWRHVLQAVGDNGRLALAPDFPGFGDSEPDLPGTWERQAEAVERFRRALGLDRVALIVHDWGGLIGLLWACQHPDEVAAMVISNTGFFPNGRWHGMARALRKQGEGERLMGSLTREGFGQMIGAVSPRYDRRAADEYWKTFATAGGRRSVLDLYRSGDFEKLTPYQGRLAELGVPTLVLWGEEDVFAPVAGAHRFHREIPNAELVVIEGAGHFVYADEPQRCAREISGFLDRADV
jgi:haloalkane dehalogenase